MVNKRLTFSRFTISLILLIIAMILCLSQVTMVGSASDTQENSTEILWDSYGIPHIFAPNAEELFYAFGYAQMHNHADLILELLGRARGKAAEYWGEPYLNSDKWIRLMGVPERAQEWFQDHPPLIQNYVKAFVKGMNDFATKYPDQIAGNRTVVLPITPIDILAHTQQAIHFTFITNARIIEQVAKQTKMEPAGSNAWAVAPKHTENGNALLLCNPHLPWSDLFTWFEAQLVAPGINATGAAFVGTPLLGIAFNDNLGWTHTVNTHDGYDLYELSLTEDGYQWDDSHLPFQEETQYIKVKKENGTFQEVPLKIRQSIHGPVIASGEKKAIALRVVGLDRPNITEQYWKMMRARNLKEFEQAQKMLQMPMFTVMYADKDGHIMHLFGGHTPVRPEEDWNWNAIVPGNTSKTLWTQYHTYDELPKIIDPVSGWLQNANDPPWTTTIPLAIDRDDYPPYMAPLFMHFRAQRSARMLRKDIKISYDELSQYSLSTRMEVADRILDELIPAAKNSEKEKALKAAEILEKWDRCADQNSQGAVLFKAFWRQIEDTKDGYPFAEKWDISNPITTPDGLANKEKAIDILIDAYEKVEEKYGKPDIAWGEVHRLVLGDVNLPANGGGGSLGIFRVTGYEQTKDGKFQARGGDSYKAVIEFSQPLRAQALLTYGNASQPDSPHRTDQLELYSQKKYRPVWRTRKEIESHLEKKETISMK